MNDSAPQPHYCSTAAYDLFAQQVQDLEAEGALLRAAIAIAMHEMPELEYQVIEDQITEISNEILSRVHSDNPRALVSHAHQVLFEEQGFQGNQENYYDPGNSYISQVLATRRGIPITLALVYKEVLERIGMSVTGISTVFRRLVSIRPMAPVLLLL